MNTPFQTLPLNALRTFAVASRHRSFTAAAAHIGVSQVAVSRQIATLEAYLGAQLFERSARAVRLTDVGRAFGQEIAAHFDAIEQATHRLRTEETDSTITLRVYPTFADLWLLPRLKSFSEAWPQYRVRLDTAVEQLDFRGTPLDVAIQLGHGDWRDAKARKLFDESVDMVCSPAYARRFDGFRDPAEIGRAELLHARYRRREWEVWANAAGVEVNHRLGMEFDSSLLLYSAARQGYGLAIGQIDLLQPDLSAGTLVRPLERSVRTGAAFHVVWPEMKSVTTKTRRLIDWLLTSAGQPPEFFRAAGRGSS